MPTLRVCLLESAQGQMLADILMGLGVVTLTDPSSWDERDIEETMVWADWAQEHRDRRWTSITSASSEMFATARVIRSEGRALQAMRKLRGARSYEALGPALDILDQAVAMRRNGRPTNVLVPLARRWKAILGNLRRALRANDVTAMHDAVYDVCWVDEDDGSLVDPWGGRWSTVGEGQERYRLSQPMLGTALSGTGTNDIGSRLRDALEAEGIMNAWLLGATLRDVSTWVSWLPDPRGP